MEIKKWFYGMNELCEPITGANFQWTSNGIGFGQMHFYLSKEDGYVHCDNEIMSRSFLKKMLCHMVDNCVLDCPNGTFPDDGPNGQPPGYNPKPITD
jgi:hypothetical protein